MNVFLQTCQEVSPFSAMQEAINTSLAIDQVVTLPPDLIQLVKEIAGKIFDEITPVFKGTRAIRAYPISQHYEIVVHSSDDEIVKAGNHASGGQRKFIAVVVSSSGEVICRQTDSVDALVREALLKENQAIQIYPDSIHGFELPPSLI